MKLKNSIKAFFALAAAASTFIATQSADAAITYHVTVDTSALLSAPGSNDAPFALDFQLNGGDSLANSATVYNFNFGGGSANTNPGATFFGLATGSLTSSVSLSDSSSSFSNEFYQGFNPGNSLSFDISLTTNLNGPTPDGFSFAILDGSLANLATNGPGDSLLLININSANPVAQTFSSTSGVTVTAVPEPGTILVGLALVGICGSARRRRAA